jgi:hypothetical protein
VNANLSTSHIPLSSPIHSGANPNPNPNPST